MAAIQEVEVIHNSVSGRARLHVPALHRSPAFKSFLEGRLMGVPGIEHVSANPYTGNLLVLYNSELNAAGLASLIRSVVTDFSAQFDPPEGRALSMDSTDRAKRSDSFPDRRTSAAGSSPHVPWHQLSPSEAMAALEASPSGLRTDQIPDRLKRYGTNLLTGPKSLSAVETFVDQFKSLPVALLVVGSGLTFLTAGTAEAAVILGALGFNAVIGFFVERRAERTIQSLRSQIHLPATVLRDGEVKTIDAREVVPGDILVLKSGSFVPADARVIEANRLRLNESALTGESMPVPKQAEPLTDQEAPLAERLNMVHRGTLVSGGNGLAMAVATGRSTELGRIYGLVHQATETDTPLERTLNHLARQLVVVSGLVWGASFLVGVLRGYGLLTSLNSALSLAVAAIPEGLPTITTTTLALGIQNMRTHRVMIRRLEAVEALGSIQTLCFDKTGTVTLNRVTVLAFYTGMRRIEVSAGQFSADQAALDPFGCEELLRLIQTSVLCSDTEVRREGDRLVLSGPPMDNALMDVATGAGLDVLALRRAYPLASVGRGSAQRKFMVSVRLDESTNKPGSRLIAVKGRPAAVLSRCQYQMKEGRTIPLSHDDRRQIGLEAERFSSDGMRVVGFAYREVDSPEQMPEEDPADLTWLGIAGLADPIRPGAREVIRSFHEAGITTVMITGDRTTTAYAISKELGLARENQIELLDSAHLHNLAPDVLSSLTERVHVFTRLSPAQKREIVLALQRRDKIVAVTGDGINDAPALKEANIGIAMGQSGTILAREVADIILEDDRLETMVIAVCQGRTIYDNIRKATRYLLATTVAEVILQFARIALRFQGPSHLLWMNPLFPALSLALEPPEADVLKRPPRPPDQPIIDRGEFKRITFEGAAMALGALGAYGYGTARYGPGLRAGTLAFMSLSTAQIFHVLSCRSDDRRLFANAGLGSRPPQPPNRYIWISIGGTLLLQGVTILVPGLRTLLGLSPISLLDAGVIGGSALVPLLINEATKEGEHLPSPDATPVLLDTAQAAATSP